MVERSVARRGSSSSLLGAVALLALALGCGRSGRHVPSPGNVPSDGGEPGTGTGGSAVTGGAGGRGGSAGSKASGGSSGSDGAGTAGAAGEASEPACGLAPSGLVRLTSLQVKSALGSLLGAAAAEEITTDLDIPTQERAELPALASESQAIDDLTFTLFDRIAQATGKYVRDNVEAVTDCTLPTTGECARAFLEDFTQRAFRKTADGMELALVLGVYDGALADLDASVEEALEAGVYAALESPRFTYRFELGAADAAPGTVPLEPHEVASALAFFLTAAPPDAELVAAATAGALATPEDLEPHVARLLASDAGRARLTAAVGSHFRLHDVRNVALDTTRFPAWNADLASAMEHESRLFLSNTLWSEPLSSLVTSRTTEINAPLAALYGVAFPPADDALDADGFGRVELPAERSGLLTQGATLAVSSRPSGHSTIWRGHYLRQRFVCQPAPPVEGSVDDPQQIIDANAMLADRSEREKARYRVETPFCSQCHSSMDAYGIALEEFDAIGAFRQVDDEGEPVDATTVLPEAAGSARVTGAAELGAALADGDTLARCLGAAFLGEGLSARWPSQDPARSCEVEEIVNAHAASGDPSFGGLVRAIALSPAFRERAKAEQ